MFVLALRKPGGTGLPGEPLPPSPPGASIVTRYGVVPDNVGGAIQAYWPQGEWVHAAEVAYLESGWNPEAVNDTRDLGGGECNISYELPGGGLALTEYSVGLFQINICAHGGTFDGWANVDANVSFAHTLYVSAGNCYTPWYLAAGILGLCR